MTVPSATRNGRPDRNVGRKRRAAPQPHRGGLRRMHDVREPAGVVADGGGQRGQVRDHGGIVATGGRRERRNAGENSGRPIGGRGRGREQLASNASAAFSRNNVVNTVSPLPCSASRGSSPR